MSELDVLLQKARSVDPVPAGTIERVAARLAPKETRLNWLWAAPLFAMFVAWALLTPPRMIRAFEEPPQPGAPRFVVQRFAQRTRAPVPRAPTVKPAAPPIVEEPVIASAPAPIVPGAVITPDPPSPPRGPSSRDNVARYRPRATRELEIDWRTLEQEELSRVVRAIVDRRDRGALLAELDRERPLSTTLLIARGQLRASAERCDEAITDFDRALEAGAAEPSRTWALDGRAACRP